MLIFINPGATMLQQGNQGSANGKTCSQNLGINKQDDFLGLPISSLQNNKNNLITIFSPSPKYFLKNSYDSKAAVNSPLNVES